MTKSGLNVLNRDFTSSSKPLKTLKTTIKAIVPIVTPATDIPEIILMILCDFFGEQVSFCYV